MPDFTTRGRDLVGRRVDDGRFELVSVLGIGAYGVVYLAVDVRSRLMDPANPKYVAVKCLARTGLDDRQRHFQRREITIHQLASGHPNIASVHKVVEQEDGKYIFVIMDYLPGGDLFAMITERGRYVGNDELVRSVFLQIVDAVSYCHTMGIFHRDLKPENILCSADGTRVCVADFGLATTERLSRDFGCGSTFYLSPECQGGLFEPVDSYSTAQADLWSLGVILVNLACGRNPWRQACADDDTFRAYLDDPSLLSTILPLSHEASTILAGLFARDPADRINLAQLRAMVAAAPTFSSTPRAQHAPSPAPSPPAHSSSLGVSVSHEHVNNYFDHSHTYSDPSYVAGPTARRRKHRHQATPAHAAPQQQQPQPNHQQQAYAHAHAHAHGHGHRPAPQAPLSPASPRSPFQPLNHPDLHTAYANAQYAQARHPYAAVDTPASTPGLVPEHHDAYTRTESTSSFGSVPPTPELVPATPVTTVSVHQWFPVRKQKQSQPHNAQPQHHQPLRPHRVDEFLGGATFVL